MPAGFDLKVREKGYSILKNLKQRDYQVEWAKKNPDKMRSKWNAHRDRYNKSVRLLIDIRKAAPCMDCKKRFPAVAMDFDHRDPTQKTSEIGRMLANHKKPSKIFEEIAKCDLVCANCHRIRTWLKDI